MPDERQSPPHPTLPSAQLEDLLGQFIKNMKDDQHKDQTVSHWLSSELLRQEFKLTSKIYEGKFVELSSEIKGMTSSFVTRAEFNARKELDDKEHDRLNTEIGKKADEDVAMTRLDRLEKIAWLVSSSTILALLMAFLNLIIKST